MAVEISEPQEPLKLLPGLRAWRVQDCRDLCWVHLPRNNADLHFSSFTNRLLCNALYMLCVQIKMSSRYTNTKRFNISWSTSLTIALECCRCIGESKRHHEVLVVTSWNVECHLPLITPSQLKTKWWGFWIQRGEHCCPGEQRWTRWRCQLTLNVQCRVSATCPQRKILQKRTAK